MIPIPLCFSVDLMHLICINTGELIIPLWCGQLKCDPNDNKETWDWVKLIGETWVEHRKLVTNATQYFPSSFHHPPQNPVEKILSGYKATEYYLYIFGLGPRFFRPILPKKYWKNFCKLVQGAQILIQHSITGKQIWEAHSFLIHFVEEYKNLYYQRQPEWLHFCRPLLHTLLHAAPEIMCVGPGSYSSQYTMECTIRDFDRDIQQPSNPFANLCQIALRQAQTNVLKIIYTELDPDAGLHAISDDVGNGYFLLAPCEKYPSTLHGGPEWIAIHTEFPHMTGVRQWGRLNLLNGQIA
jgi:hypothetical protein